MEPQKSILIPVTLAVVESAVVFGGLGYYWAMNENGTTTTLVTPTYTTQSKTALSTSTPTPVATTTPSTATDVTANWKTYENTTYHYSVKYPPTWKVDLQAKDANKNPIATFLTSGSENAPGAKMIEIQVSSASLEESTKALTLKSKVTIDGVVGNQYITSTASTNDTSVYVQKGMLYNISLHNTTTKDSDYLTTFNDMLSTFKFTQ